MALKKRTSRPGADCSIKDLPQGSPAKKLKLLNDSTPDTRKSWTLPSEYWDRLSKVELTHRALGELDRRTRQSTPSLAQLRAQQATEEKSISRFARHGGPDMTDLRGFPNTTETHTPAVSGDMSSNLSSARVGGRSVDTASTPPTTNASRSKKSTVYSRNFEQHLTDHNVEPLYGSEEPDLAGISSELAQPRASLSPSKFSDGAFKTFRQNNVIAKDEDDVLANVMPAILGSDIETHRSGRNTTFGNLEPLTDGTVAPAKPDIYYGSLPEELSPSVRERIGSRIMPSTMHDKPLAPNFFVEVKGPDGNAAVAMRQARYDGAIGARGMHSLQNYGREQSQYDGQAYVFSSTYHDGTLKVYAHHPTAPKTDDALPRYHMTQVDGWAMTGNRSAFVRGATAFRNARDLAKQHRDTFIRAANARASTARSQGVSTVDKDEVRHQDDSADEFVDCEEYVLPHNPSDDSSEGAGLDEHTQTSLLPAFDDAATTSFTPSFSSRALASSAKRQRRPVSPHSKSATRSPPSKVRHLQGADIHTRGTSTASEAPADRS